MLWKKSTTFALKEIKISVNLKCKFYLLFYYGHLDNTSVFSSKSK